MAKNDWKALDTGAVSNMNQPFWIASGVYNAGASRIELQITPGSIRYPNLPDLTYNEAAQSVWIANPQANQFLTLYVRPDGSFMVSGTTAQTPVPGSPRYDAEPLGRIYTGNPISTANLIGPWNTQGAGAYEERGQMTATAGGRPRMVYQAYIRQDTTPGGNGFTGYVPTLSAASGIAWLTINDGNAVNVATYLSATVQWEASGAAGSNGLLDVYPTFKVVPGFNGTWDNQALYYEHRQFTANQPPPSVSNYQLSHMSWIVPSGSYSGYALLAGNNVAGGGIGKFFVRTVLFSAMSGFYGSNSNELA